MTATDDLLNVYCAEHPESARDFVEKLPAERLAGFAGLIDSRSVVRLFEVLTPSRGVELFEALPPQQRTSVLGLCTPRVAVLLLSGLDADVQAQVLASLPAATRSELERILNFPQDTAARLMEGATDTLRPDMNVAQARERLRRAKVRRARSLYVVDTAGRLVGRVDVQDLATQRDERPLAELTHAVEAWALMTASREELVNLFTLWGFDSIPIVDNDRKLVGVVRYAGLLDAAQSVASADLQKMVGVSADERALSSPSFAVKRRLPWLHINLLTAFMAAAVVGLFEDLISQITALAILLPVVAGQSGNAGAQALAVTMRGLALREIGLQQWSLVLRKETLVGLVDGLALAVTCGAGVFLWSQSLGLALVIGIAMVLSMIAAGMAGAAVPMLLIRFGQDPATASSIILTTVTDIAGFFAFLGTATLLVSLLA